jgi:hypothetical protein
MDFAKFWERSSAFQRVGGQVGMLPTAFHALEALDTTLSETVKKDAIDRLLLRRYNPRGQLDKEMKFTKGKGVGAMTIPWFDLQQQSLVQSLRLVPEKDNMIHLEHELENLYQDEENDLVCLEFTNGCDRSCLTAKHPNMPALIFGACLSIRPSEEESIPDCLKRLGESNVWTGNGKVLAL